MKKKKKINIFLDTFFHRCTALGVFVCFSQIGALLGSTLYTHLPVTTTKIAATISTIFTTIPFVSSIVLKDPCLLV